MANPNRVTGRAKVSIAGAVLATAGDTTLDIGGTMREPVSGDFEAGGFRESEPKPSKLEVNILNKANFDPVAFAAIENETISVEFDTGQTFVIRQAWSEGAPPMTTNDGKAKGVLYGKPAERVR